MAFHMVLLSTSELIPECRDRSNSEVWLGVTLTKEKSPNQNNPYLNSMTDSTSFSYKFWNPCSLVKYYCMCQSLSLSMAPSFSSLDFCFQANFAVSLGQTEHLPWGDSVRLFREYAGKLCSIMWRPPPSGDLLGAAGHPGHEAKGAQTSCPGQSTSTPMIYNKTLRCFTQSIPDGHQALSGTSTVLPGNIRGQGVECIFLGSREGRKEGEKDAVQTSVGSKQNPLGEEPGRGTALQWYLMDCFQHFNWLSSKHQSATRKARLPHDSWRKHPALLKRPENAPKLLVFN